MQDLLQPTIIIFIYFITIFVKLFFYVLIAWIICSYLILFGAMARENKLNLFLESMVAPVLKPFRWARIGPIDLSPIVAMWVLLFIVDRLVPVLMGLISA